MVSLAMCWATPALATTWKNVTPPAKFVTYAKHARRHGMQAWYPRRIPTGYVIGTMRFGDTGGSGPYCDIVFKKGSRKIYFSQGTVVGADGDAPARIGTCQWGASRADVYRESITWYGSANAFAGLSGSLSLADEKSMAKTMRKVP
ncbi:hypothetical protein FDZ74_00070 [bacterium]|nr:MAG: hypothetical protein FDZ74_00070 [bacterium]